MAKYLDREGLNYFWGKIKDFFKITTTNNVTTIHMGNNNVVPVTTITAGTGLNTTSNDTTTDGGTIGNGTSNSGTLYLTKTGVTPGSYGPSTNATPSAGSTFTVPQLTVDKQGRITAASDKTVTVPSAQTITQDGLTGATINRYGSCSTAAGTAAKTVSVTNGTVPTLNASAAGLKVTVKFNNANTANNPTLNVDSKGAKNIFHNGSQITTGENKALLAGVCDFIFDGTQWHLVGNYIDTKYTIGNKALVVSSNTGTATQAITVNENSSDRTLQIKGDGTYLSGAVSGSSNAPVITLTPTDSGATAGSYGDSGNQTPGYGSTFKVPYVTVDVKGRVTGISEHTVKIPASDNVDTKVKQTAKSDNVEYKLLMGANSSPTSGTSYEAVYDTSITVNPSSDTITASNFAGKINDVTVSKATTGFTIAGGTTSKTLTVNNTYTLGAACAKAVDSSISANSSSTNLPTSAAVESRINQAITDAQVGAAMFQGVIKSGTSLTALPTSGYKKGWYWIVGTAGTYAGVVCEAGDTIFCVNDYASAFSNDDFNVVQTNIETITNGEIDTIIAGS